MSHDTKLNLHQRLHAVMGEVDYIQKERKGGVQYTIISHDAVTAKVRPVLVKHGVVYYPVGMDRKQDGNRTEMTLTIRFANIDDPTDHIDVVSAGYGIDGQDKGPGKAISYAVKFALLKTLGLETGDDPDYDNKPHEPRTPPPPKPPARPANVERDRHFGNAADEIRSGQNGIPGGQKPAAITVKSDPKAWVASESGKDFIRDARHDLGTVETMEGLRKWEADFRDQLDAFDEHGGNHTMKDGRTYKQFVDGLVADTYDRVRANVTNLRAAG